MKKPKLAWYENNKDFTDPISIFLRDYFEVKVFGFPHTAEKEITE